MYKIYYGDKSLIIISASDELNLNEKNAARFDCSESGLQGAIENLDKHEKQCSIIIAEDEKEALNALKKHYIVIQAGGGLVYAPEAYLLLIFRKGKWDLPSSF
jgi:hypothetical protein